ncbi:murein DD-endopeptidase MepM/ murein hydrolase activator NlpD [Nocardia transvalensis]|uniref:Murein DD-endopeptidase MepM/ murein hydrolase activator NlpD n=1 Tax=Nocardia transvalensis TaxID=37333 RepID=A0A7W9PFE4_9NOCA|nr:M23 family metallopeptidase [Nocardia transvalensis]MBB5914609.1 murein DD-endopeptidase MepM/ murein hydrolase activator NlpD [Nocardia transvalensis]
MSTDPFQQGHRAQSARRYRQDGEAFGPRPFGDPGSFGGYAGPAAAPVRPSQTPAWGAGPGQWTPSPAENAWDQQSSGPAWHAQSADTSWDPQSSEPSWDAWETSDSTDHGDYDYRAADDDKPFDSGWPRTDSGTAVPAEPIARPTRVQARRAGAHRMPPPPTAVKGRAAVVAVAAGAVVAAGQATVQATGQNHSSTADYQADGQVHEIAPQAVSIADPAAAAPQSSQLVSVAPLTDINQFSDILQHGQQFAADLAAAEAAKLRPLYTRFAYGNFTSTFGFRWGAPHNGVDVAAPIGTPIYAVEDGTVIDAGPASGFGMWVRLRHDDGTVTVYGHVDTTTVSVGQRVMAGDQIATVGNRGFSTGPHCHFEVHLNGNQPIDPIPWLASRGISLGPERD